MGYTFLRAQKMKLREKVAIITGGNSGIGLSTSYLFAKQGACVSIVARDKTRGEKAVNEIIANGGKAMFTPCDVTQKKDCQLSVSRTIEAFGRIDILFNNAGLLLRERTLLETTETEWDAIMSVNVKGVFLMSKAALPIMLKQKSGNIINNASCYGLVGGRGLSAYSASKGAIVLLTKSMALDYADKGIRVNCVCAGSVDTPMIKTAIISSNNEEKTKQLFIEKHPIGRLALPDEIASAVLFLAADDASFMTGTSLTIDGGITAS